MRQQDSTASSKIEIGTLGYIEGAFLKARDLTFVQNSLVAIELALGGDQRISPACNLQFYAFPATRQFWSRCTDPALSFTLQ